MKWFAFPIALSLASGTVLAQQPDYSEFYDWFHQVSQVGALYSDQSTLLIFNDDTKVMSRPSWKSTLLTQLDMATPVSNIAYPDGFIPNGTRNGYTDIWYKVKGKDAGGKSFTGYVWGGDLAKGWRKADLSGGPDSEWLLLGLSSSPRIVLTDIRAELRVVSQGKILARQEIKGLCLFEECASSPLLRIIRDPKHPEYKVIEASAMTESCEVGIERAFLFWDGARFQPAYHAEFVSRTVFQQATVVLNDPDTGIPSYRCRFSHIDTSFNPVWIYSEIRMPVTAPGPIARAR